MFDSIPQTAFKQIAFIMWLCNSEAVKRFKLDCCRGGKNCCKLNEILNKLVFYDHELNY